MAETITTHITGRVAIVTGSNRGIGFEICRQLAAKGVIVVLTSRDEKKGVEALQKLRGFGLSDNVLVFHQLDVMDSDSVASLFGFIKTRFGKLDILVNNAGVLGVDGDALAIRDYIMGNATRASDCEKEELSAKANGAVIETYELAEKCLQTDYYGAKRMIEAFIPLLQLSDSPRIHFKKFLSNEWARNVLSDAESLTEERVKEGSLQQKNWPPSFPAYIVAKAALNGYTRAIAKKYPTFLINCADPGHVQTDMSCYTGLQTVEEGAEIPVKAALLPEGGPSGVFFAYQLVPSSDDNYPIKSFT